VAENARLEQELVVLRQKLQASRRGSEPHHQWSAVTFVPDSVSTGTTAALEAELRRVQQLVGDLQRQRQELSLQVQHLTEKSHSLVQQIRPGPTGVAGMWLPATIRRCNIYSLHSIVIAYKLSTVLRITRQIRFVQRIKQDKKPDVCVRLAV
jgi:hypothetical protein